MGLTHAASAPPVFDHLAPAHSRQGNWPARHRLGDVQRCL